LSVGFERRFEPVENRSREWPVIELLDGRVSTGSTLLEANGVGWRVAPKTK